MSEKELTNQEIHDFILDLYDKIEKIYDAIKTLKDREMPVSRTCETCKMKVIDLGEIACQFCKDNPEIESKYEPREEDDKE